MPTSNTEYQDLLIDLHRSMYLLLERWIAYAAAYDTGTPEDSNILFHIHIDAYAACMATLKLVVMTGNEPVRVLPPKTIELASQYVTLLEMIAARDPRMGSLLDASIKFRDMLNKLDNAVT